MATIVVTILRGGMVANFTGAPESGLPKYIQMTRGLIFSAVLQIIENEELLQLHHGAIMLDPRSQMRVVEYWFKDVPEMKKNYSMEIINGFNDINWVRANSDGDVVNPNVKKVKAGPTEDVNNSNTACPENN